MNESEHPDDPERSTLSELLRSMRRGWFIIAAAVVVTTASAVYAGSRQEPVYQAGSQVLLSRQNLANTLTGTPDAQLIGDFERVVQTQAQIARTPAVAERVVRALRLRGRSPGQILANTTIEPSRNADLLNVTVEDGDPILARQIANTFAEEYAGYRRQLDTAALARARTSLTQRIARLEAAGGNDSLVRRLRREDQQLQTLESLQTTSAVVVRRASGAGKVRPNARRNGILGIFAGLLLGIAAAVLRERLDTRIRTAEEMSERLGYTLLARIPEPPRQLRSEDRLLMLDEPYGPKAEAYRLLRINLDFANVDRQAKVIMVTSAVESEGKSTTAANLAAAYARMGRRVALVDLDWHRPYVHKFLGLNRAPGVTNVLLGTNSFEETLVRADLHAASQPTAWAVGGSSMEWDAGSLEILPAGVHPPNAGELVGSQRLHGLLAQMRESFDLVIIDTPPVLRLGDALTISQGVDGILLVAKLGVISRPTVKEIRRALEGAPAPVIGVVVTGAESDEGYSYGYGYGYAPKDDDAAEPDAVRVKSA